MVKAGVNYPMISDTGGNLGKLYGVFDEEGLVNLRGRFIIDPEGIVQTYEVLTPSVGRDINELLRQLKALQVVSKSCGSEATPAGWTPGKKTLLPKPELVGNVWKEWKVEDQK